MSTDPPSINYYRSPDFDCDKPIHPRRLVREDRDRHLRLAIECDRLSQN